jgi:hypothetical protein
MHLYIPSRRYNGPGIMYNEASLRRSMAASKRAIIASVIVGVAGTILAVVGLAIAIGNLGGATSTTGFVVGCASVILVIIAAMVHADHVARYNRWKQAGSPVVPAKAIVNPGPVMVDRMIIKETVREIVKIKCAHCGMLVENTSSACPNCAATM